MSKLIKGQTTQDLPEPGMTEEDVLFLRFQAERCRWLATQSTEPKVIARLRNMAREYELKASALDIPPPSLPTEGNNHP